ncbi:MAG: hypothetical protein NVSMB9_04660 [Isosphaeraceae bacterium]
MRDQSFGDVFRGDENAIREVQFMETSLVKPLHFREIELSTSEVKAKELGRVLGFLLENAFLFTDVAMYHTQHHGDAKLPAEGNGGPRTHVAKYEDGPRTFTIDRARDLTVKTSGPPTCQSAAQAHAAPS